ncbi:MAG: DNA starvation/stationary phase protection protein [Nocardioidaceae bacterium]|nr:DNA starvation/stationary phase protection protein [Nocardioidaceae bacterium]
MARTKSDSTSVTDRPRVGSYTTPGLTHEDGHQMAEILQARLNALNDLALTLKHVHWNVVGPHFIGVHEMIDPHVVEVRDMVDETAERIATLGAAPLGTPGSIVANRTWEDYSLTRGSTDEHLGALDVVYVGLLEDHRKSQEAAAELDPVSEDMLIGQIKQLELFHWFVRAHLENYSGALSTGSATSEKSAAKRAASSH